MAICATCGKDQSFGGVTSPVAADFWCSNRCYERSRASNAPIATPAPPSGFSPATMSMACPMGASRTGATVPDGYALSDMTVDLEKHIYAWKGVQVPGVTRIWRYGNWQPSFAGVPSATLEAARARGTEVHAYAHAVDRGLPGEVTATTANYIAADVRVRKALPIEVVASELPLVHPVLRYGGRIDLVGWYAAQRVIADRKTGSTVHASVWLQLAAYRMLYAFWYPEWTTAKTLVLHTAGTRSRASLRTRMSIWRRRCG